MAIAKGDRCLFLTSLTTRSAETAKALFRSLEHVDKDLSGMIEEVNRFSVSGSLPASGIEDGASKDPVHQITAILNTHVTSLEWINDQTAKLKEEVGKLERQQERAGGGQPPSRGAMGASTGPSGARAPGTPLNLGRSGLRSSGFRSSPR